MSKQGKRKITVELPKQKDLSNRPSVFERLGIKKASSKKTTEHCRQWAQHGSCAYGKSCKFASTHTLISPSKQRAAIKDSEQKRSVKDDPKSRVHSSVVVRPGHSPDGEIDKWDQNDLDYADADALEKRRLQLQRELELQLKMDGKDMRKDKKKPVSSTSSSRSSSSSSASSSTSDGSSSSSSSDRDARRKVKKGKLKRNSSSSSEGDVPSKKKFNKSDTLKTDKSVPKKNITKKDDKPLKKIDTTKKKLSNKTSIGKSLSPAKKSGGTPPITSKTLSKNLAKRTKSPPRRERNRSASPHSTRDRDKDRKEKEKEKDKDRDKDREKTKPRSRSPRKAKSRSPRPHKDSRRKESSERSRPVSPKKPVRKDGSSDRHRKRSASRDRDRGREHKDRSLERRKDKNEEKERNDRKDRGRDRKDKRDDKRRGGRGGGREGLGGSRGTDKGLEKPNKPMERLLPRPEERLAALAAISNRTVETDKNSTTSKDRADTHSERGGRKTDRGERDRSTKRDRLDSMDREPADYEMDRQYDTDRVEHYDRGDDRYEAGARDSDRSPGYAIQGRERHYDAGYDMAGPPRGYAEDDERMYADRLGDRRDIGYDDRRPHRDRSWEGRSSIDRERGYMHPHKEWDNEDYRGAGDWGRDRRWPMHESQMSEWGDKDREMEGWHHRGHPGQRGRMHENYGRGMRMDHKRRGAPRNEPPPAEKQTLSPAPPAAAAVRPATAPVRPAVAPVRPDTGVSAEADDKPIPDDLSEISDDPDDILNRDDMADQNMDDDSQTGPLDDSILKPEPAERESTQDTSGADDRESKDINDDEDTNLDFEEISDGELEEERTRAGLGDALGVDWASLVADVHRREQTTPSGGARDRWRPEKVLTRVGLSIQMAGKEIVQEILNKNAETDKKESGQSRSPGKDGIEQNGTHENELSASDVNSLHPVAAIQVAIEKRKRQRALLFGSGCEITRGLSARRDLALRRFLCHLPATERTGQSRVTPQPSLFQAAKALLVQAKSG